MRGRSLRRACHRGRQRRIGASGDRTRVERRCGAILVIDVGLDPGCVFKPWQDMEPLRIGDQQDVAEPGHSGQAGRFIVPDRQHGAVREILQEQARRGEEGLHDTML